MNGDQLKQYEELVKQEKELSNNWIDYWFDFSGLYTWEFWFNFMMLVVPLIALFFFLDRKRAFHIGFFGYSMHVIALYFDGFGTRNDLWGYPHKVLPFFPVNVGLDSSLIPVVYMLLYQWVRKTGKNYYVYAFFVSVFFAFFFKPIMEVMGLFKLGENMKYIYLFMFYIAGAVGAKLVTDLFLAAEKSADKSSEEKNA
ncbi:MAG TPA: CBO0543 family protein [Bacillus sp. (in: firmicutes)]|uniref:CBO0543 family protein n=1 Tax=Bacillus litorisediminis TaxID=2922713 RepID=UPI001FAE179A|nr:CBO0543 family protein [Bacillus litorisediminis]HWO74362.1 CBO0543 family protein [Bacillus sp. (in: firmicutes)]